MRGAPLTSSEKNIITQWHAIGRSNLEIAKEINRSPQTVANYLDRTGIKQIKHYEYAQNADKNKTCPHCKAKNHNKGARFCWKCGNDIRSEAAVLSERVSKLLRDVLIMPENMRDEASNTLQAALKHLQAEDSK